MAEEGVNRNAGVASGGRNVLRHPVRYWRHWGVYLSSCTAMIYGSRPVAEALGDQAFAYVYIAVIAVFMYLTLRWAERRAG